MGQIRTLLDRQELAGPTVLPEALSALYGGDLRLPGSGSGRPYVIGNFVSTLDGVVSFAIPGKSGGGDISGSNPEDRFIMGLLRASADAVMVGARTLREVSQSHLFAAESIYRAASDSYARYRREILHKPRYPLNVIVSGSGKIDLERAIFHTPDLHAVIFTTEEGGQRLTAAGAGALDSIDVRTIEGSSSPLSPDAMLEILGRDLGVGLLLHEGGPALFGSFVAKGLVDEFFLTIAPQLAGREGVPLRPGMIAGIDFSPETAPWLDLVSVKQTGNHLYLRYRKGVSPV